MQHRFFANIVWQDVYEKKVCIWPLCPSLDHTCVHTGKHSHSGHCVHLWITRVHTCKHSVPFALAQAPRLGPQPCVGCPHMSPQSHRVVHTLLASLLAQ